MSFRRVPKEIDPRRPPKRRRRRGGDGEDAPEPRSYGQYVEMTPDEVAELERATGEVAREGASAEGDVSDRAARRELEAREAFEETTDEVTREDGDDR